jgi:hypothetical protein
MEVSARMIADSLYLKNKVIRVGFSRRTGALMQIEDKLRGCQHLQGDEQSVPFRLARQGGRMQGAYRVFDFEQREGSLTLHWSLSGCRLEATVTLLDDGLSFSFLLTGPGAAKYHAVEYPILGALSSWGQDSYLAHAYATGLLMRNPAAHLPARGRLRFCPYPEGFSGATMQFMAYYHPGKGGLYLAAEDGQARQKWLNAYTHRGSLVLSYMHGFEHIGAACIRQDYPFVLRLYAGEGWEEAADLYRAFAHCQPWCARGPAYARRTEDDWLREHVGYCTFGISASHDRSRWLKQFREDIGTPGFHVLGPDWTNKPQTFGMGVPGGMDDWLPTRFDARTLAAIRANGDRFAPFEFDFLVNLNQSDRQRLRDNLQAFPVPTYSHDGYRFNMLCPAQPFTQAFHRDRDRQVQRESGCDAMYYDISANNLIKICTREDHVHRPGGGSQINEGYQTCYRQTAEAMAEQAGKPIPLGTELINETFLAELDFYQARAWAQPATDFETWPFRKQMRSGQFRMIPLFDYVYHEFGPVRMDGWGKLVKEIGDLFYYNVARTYLWGGLYELNYEYSPMEALDGRETDPQEHYFHFEPQGYAYDRDRAAYLGSFARARIGDAKPYWSYGRLMAQPKLQPPTKVYSWYHYNHDKHSPAYQAGGDYPAPAVVSSLYRDEHGGFACFLANTSGESHRIPARMEDILPGVESAQAVLYRFDGQGRALIETDFGMQARDLGIITLEPYALYMLKINTTERGPLS